MNYFKTAVVGESEESQIRKKPIYLISGGPYTPFKGAMTAGAEYNSIKDNELAPNSFWYKVTVEEKPIVLPGERPYIVRVNPIQYVAHQINFQGTDKLVAGVETLIESASDELVQGFVDQYSRTMSTPRRDGRRRIREILLANKSIAEENAAIAEYIASKKGKKPLASETPKKIEDLGANVPAETPKAVFTDESTEDNVL
jgi:hypothetical protein